MATELTAVDYLTRSVDRNRYFYGKLMTVRDFLREQEYFNSKRWLINRLLFGSGIVCGLEVAAVPADGAGVVEIQPGVAFDPYGREITVSERTRVDLAKLLTPALTPGGKADVSLLVRLEYHECPKEPVPSLGASPCEEACESNRVGETFTVSVVKAPPKAEPPTPCENWLNRQTVRRPSGEPEDTEDFLVERVAPVWVRQNEVFEVALKVTARRDVTEVELDERVAGGTIIEPQQQPPTDPPLKQFPTAPVSLRKGEFFVYVYQVQAPPTLGDIQLSGGGGVPTPPLKVRVIDRAEADRAEAEMRLGACPGEPEPSEKFVPVAQVTASFESGSLKKVVVADTFDQQRFRYNLTRVAELLDCVRASLRAEAESQRPGHLFITFKDVERNELQPIGPVSRHGESWTVTRGDHVHALLLYENSGLDFQRNKLRIEGNVGGSEINFLNPVSGQSPEEPQHLTTKEYVDALLSGLDWQESVLDKDATAPPATAKRTKGERYLLFENPAADSPWAGHQGSVATWDGRKWVFADPDEGTAVFVDDESIAYLYVKNKWIPFLATPTVAAGKGLFAKEAVINVGQGPGLKVNENDVEVVYQAALPAPVGPLPSAGAAAAASRGDHTHALPLTPNGGLAFGTLKGTEIEKPSLGAGLYINGIVGGANIDFLHPVWGQAPKEPRHLATKQYVDGVAAGLDWQNSVLDKDLTEPPPAPPAGARYLVLGTGPIIIDFREVEVSESLRARLSEEREGILPPRDIEPEPLPAPEPEPEPVPIARPLDPWTGRVNNIATWDGSAWSFTAPNEGMAVFVEDENTAYLFVDGKWMPFMAMPSVAAGAGLHADGASLSVGQGSGLIVSADSVDVAYHAANPAPVGPSTLPGVSPALARGDHTHELPLALSGGLEFVHTEKPLEPIVEGDERVPEGSVRLRVNGRINGDAIEFLNPVLGQDPTAPRHLATKQYVDGLTAGLTWQNTVLDKDETRPPEEPKRGDRYLLVGKSEGEWEGHQGSIATWAGKRWEFTAPTEGMAVFVADENLAYLYADGKWVQFLAPPAAVGAGNGLIQQGTDLAVGEGEGVIVFADTVSVRFGPNVPLPVGAASFTGASRLAAQSDHTHQLPLAPSGGLEFVGVKTEGGTDESNVRAEAETNGGSSEQFLRVNGQVSGESIDFLFPVSGQPPTAPRHLATKDYVDSKGLGAGAGAGLVSNQNVLSVVGGPGLVVNPDEVHVNFENVSAQPVGAVSRPGTSNTVARGDHTHAMPDVWGTNVATGVLAFDMRQAGKLLHVTSNHIDPGLGPGTIAVVLGLEAELSNEGTFVGEIDHFEDAMLEGGGFRRFPPVLLGAAIQPPGISRGLARTTFQIWAQSTPRGEFLPETFRVRWWAYRPGTDFGVTDYMPPAPEQPSEPISDR
jgi:hypothetical protein